ncbi:protein of unknown function (plasmid) [Caballeronia sp. S22]
MVFRVAYRLQGYVTRRLQAKLTTGHMGPVERTAGEVAVVAGVAEAAPAIQGCITGFGEADAQLSLLTRPLAGRKC